MDAQKRVPTERYAWILAIIAIFLLLTSCLREDELKLPFESLEPVALNDGWEIGEPAEELTAIFRKFHADKELWQPRSLIVVKDGQLVAETYTKDRADMTRPQAVWSCTKQILAIIAMQAIEQGAITLDSTIGDLAASHPDKADITLRQLMTMTSGIRFENSGLNGDTNKLLRREPQNSVDYILSLPLGAARFNYSDGDPQIVSAMLAGALGSDVKSWSREKLFEPLEISNYDWLTYPDGVTMGAFGLKLTPRDLTKFGQLILDDGRWHGEQIITEASARLLTEPQVHTNYEQQDFGLLWWINPEDGTPYMHGQGGQYVLISREHRVVVCITAEPNTQGNSQFPLSEAFRIYREIIRRVAGLETCSTL